MNGAELSLMDCQAEAATATGMADRLNFEQAFELHHRVVYRYAAALTRDAGLAEDVAQEVFLRLYKNLDVAQRDGLLRAWLLRVAANVARNLWRTRSRGAARDEEFGTHIAQTAEVARPDETLLRQTEITAARQTLSKIKEPMRSCLLLKHEGLSYREIAAALEINESNVGSVIARGRREFIRLHGKVGK